LKWITIFLIIATVAIPVHILVVLFSKKILSESTVVVFQASLIVMQQAYLSYHMIKSHFVTQDVLDKILLDAKEQETLITNDNKKELTCTKTIISEKIFEEYSNSAFKKAPSKPSDNHGIKEFG
ncbi:MAG TPA: hypothetical protein VJY12_01625, partial [Dysgonamonadaceae bacterium]|nr:hypothetical protein [Dysgonamonadaceae bacterium]